VKEGPRSLFGADRKTESTGSSQVEGCKSGLLFLAVVRQKNERLSPKG